MTSPKKHPKRVLIRHRLRSLASVSNLLALVLALAGLVAWRLQRAGLDLSDPQVLEHYVRSLGLRGPISYIGLLTLSVVVSQLPGVPLAVAAGLVWGSLLGGVYTVAGGFLGSLIAYYPGRTLGRSAMRSLTGKVVTFSRAEGAFYLSWIVFISRLLPVVPFDIVNYASGVTGLNLPLYAAATLLGMIPFLLTFLGRAMVLNPVLALGLSVVAALSLLVLARLIRANWLGLRDLVQLEQEEKR